MNFSALARFLEELVSRGIPGADIAIMQDHKLLFRGHAGWRDREAGTALNGDELYYVYSCTKLATVVSALQLYEKGAFLLSDPLYAYLPEYRNMYVRLPNGSVTQAHDPILLRHLFTMTAGMSYALDAPSILAARAADPRCPTRAIVRALAAEPLLFEPGENWAYSLAHDVLGGLIEVLSGKKLSQYMQENLFEPLGMSRTGFYRSSGDEERFAAQYRFFEENGRAERILLANDYVFGPGYESGGAGLISCVDDYIRFADALACGGVAWNGHRILSGTTIDMLRQNQLNARQIAAFGKPGYGYGLGVRTAIDRASGGLLCPMGTFGWEGAGGAYISIDRENRLSFYYAQHMRNHQGRHIHPRLVNVVYACLDR